LLNHDGGATFETILNTLDEFGYDAEWQVLNSINFGVPQNRERVFIIGHFRGAGGRAVFPVGRTDTENTKTDKGVLAADYRYDEGFRIREEGISPCLTANMSSMSGSNNGFSNNIYAILTPDRIEKRQNGRRFKEDGEPMFTLTSQDRHGVIINPLKGKTEYGWHFEQAVYDTQGITRAVKANGGSGNIPKTIEGNQGVVLGGIYTNVSKEFQRGPLKGLSRTLKSNKNDAGITDGLRIRKLTPLECWRLQGFTDEQFYKAKNDGVSNSQLYKQAGNSVSVPVIKAIAERLL